MPFVEDAEYPTTESDSSMSPFNDLEFDRPSLPMSAYKYVRPSTLPSILWPRPTRPSPSIAPIEDFITSKDVPLGNNLLFPVTQEWLDYMAQRAPKPAQAVGDSKHQSSGDLEPAVEAGGPIT